MATTTRLFTEASRPRAISEESKAIWQLLHRLELRERLLGPDTTAIG